jgi:ubiquinone/menaquinone biosynthesis C-methylase UbiE
MPRIESFLFGAGILILILFIGAAAAAPQSVPSGKIQVEGWEKAINERQPIPKVLAAMGAEPGLSIGEIGAGTGRVTVWLADAVGPAGRIYANDIDAASLELLKARCKREKLFNVQTIIGTMVDPKFPVGALDVAFMTNTYHHLEKPLELVRHIRPALKENGRLVIVERDQERCPADERGEATSPADFVKQMDQAGFEVISTDKSMRVDNIYVARLKKL